jgi:hypothetical protein
MALDLGKQMGPLPLGAWIAVVGGGLGIAYYANRHGGGDPIDMDDVGGTPGSGVGGGPGWITDKPPAEDKEVVGKITTNEEWGRAAINHLIALNYDPILADSAIRKYLNGNVPQPSISEYALQRMALARFGSPPYPLPPGTDKPPTPPPPPIKDKPKPNPKPGPKPGAKFKYYVVKPWPAKGSTLSGIAEIYYKSASRWPDIYNANRSGKKRSDGSNGMISNPNSLRPGWKLLIP